MTLTQIAAAVAFALGLSVGGAGAWKWQASRVASAQLGLKNEQLDRTNERIAQERAARAAIERTTSAVITAQNEAATRAADLRQSADAARSESDRLRESIATAMRAAAASLDACTVTASAIGGLLAQCGREYQELGAKTDRHVSDIKTLMAAWSVKK